MQSLQEKCDMAARTGKTIDISGCNYGLHKKSGTILAEQPYYAFLAGFVSALSVRNILEVGTNCGGSIMAMSRGIPCGEPSALLTIDTTRENEEGFAAFPHIMRVQGDSLAKKTRAKVKALLPRQIDLLYIDSVHSFEHVKGNVDLYGRAHSPRYIILDDIHLNESMERVWAYFVERVGAERCCDISAAARRHTGFGVIEWRQTPGRRRRWWWPF